MSKPPVKILYEGKVRGYWHDDKKTYVSPRTKEHYCVKYHGWGIQQEIIEELRRNGCLLVVIMYQNSAGVSKPLTTEFRNYLDHGKGDVLNIQDGKQIFLHESYFRDAHKKRSKPPTTLDIFDGGNK